MLRMGRHSVIPSIMQVRTFAPKTAGWWDVEGRTCVAAYQPKGAASYAASLSNLANPGTYDADPTGSDPSWSTTYGWYGLSNTLSTGWVPTKDNFTIIVCFAATGASYWGSLAHAHNTGYVIEMAQRNTVNNLRRYQAGSSAWDADEDGPSSGVIALTIDSSTRKGYLDGNLETSTIPTGWGSSSNPLAIGSSTSGANQAISAVACYVGALSASEVATVSTAMAKL